MLIEECMEALEAAAEELQEGNGAEAERIVTSVLGRLDAAIERDAADLMARRLRGVVNQNLGRLEDARRDFDFIAQAEPSAEALRKLGDVDLALDRLDDAYRDYGLALELEEEPNAMIGRGLVHARRGEFPLAHQEFSRAVDADLDRLEARRWRGIANTSLGRHADAAEDFAAVSAREPTPEVLCRLGDARLVIGDVEEAAAAYARAVDADAGYTPGWLGLGLAATRRGDYRGAVEQFSRVLKLDPRNAVALTHRGEVRVRLDEVDGAEADFAEALDADPTYAYAHVARGRLYGWAGRLEDALAEFTHALSLDPAELSARSMRGYTLIRLGRHDEGLADYDAVVETEGSAAALTNRAEARRLAGRLSDAIEDLTRALALEPGNARVLLERGHTELLLGHYDSALRDLTAAVESDPVSTAARRLRGIANETLGNYDDAYSDYDVVARREPSAESLSNRGDAAAGRGDVETAEGDFTRALELDPANAGAYIRRARIRARREDYVAAIDDLSRAVEVAPDNLEARQLRGLVNETLGRHKEALADYEIVAEASPRADALCDLADVHMALQHLDSALRAFEEALVLDADSARAHFGRGYVLALQGQFATAAESLSEALRLEPGNSGVRRLRGVVLENLGRWLEAMADYDAVVENDPSALALTTRANARATQGDDDGAHADYARALELDPESADAYVGLGRLYQWDGDDARARAEFDAALSIDPGSADAYVGRGETTAALGEPDHALWDFDHALELAPENISALQGRAVARMEIADRFRRRGLGGRMVEAYTQSVADLDRALELSPEDSSLCVDRSTALRGLTAYDHADETAREGLRYTDDAQTTLWLLAERAEALRGWGEELHEQERLGEALEVLATAGQSSGSETPAWLPESLGATLVALERHEDALSEYERAVELDAGNAWARLGLARAAYLAREPKRAMEACAAVLARETEQALRLRAHVGRGLSLQARGRDACAAGSLAAALGDHPEADDYVDRAFCLIDFGELELAERDLRAAVRADSEAAGPRNALAWFYVDTLRSDERLGEAKALSEKAVELASASGDLSAALDTFGWVLFKLGRTREAVEPLERARSFNPYNLVYRRHSAVVHAAVAAA
jgi:tetratricopeptide (TPR) repeat protein